MKPDIEVFKSVCKAKGGNISKIADDLGVDRGTVYLWTKSDPKFQSAIDDARGRLFDTCLQTAQIVSIGIPEKDEDGKLIGWKERPDGQMLRYLMSTLGRKEGFGENLDITTNGKSLNEIKIINEHVYLTAEELEEGKDDRSQDEADPGIPGFEKIL